MATAEERRSATWSVPPTPTRVVFGAGTLDELGPLARDLTGRRVLVVTDPGVRAAGHVERAGRSLRAAGVEMLVFDGVDENPTSRHVEAGTRGAREFRTDLIVGLGGGSVMDCAKGINFLLTNGGRMEDYWGSNRATRPMLPSIGVPTTAGTGSEAQSYALIEQEEGRSKMACGDEKARFRAVVLDPDLTRTLPRRVAAVSGLDAISHAVESYVTTRGNPFSRMYAREAWRLLEGAFEGALETPDDGDLRGRMLLGAYLAGCAVEHSMLGAAHACANPLTSRYGISHGVAVLMTLPHVVRFNQPAAGSLYEDLMSHSGSSRGAASLADRIIALRKGAGIPTRLEACGVPRTALPELAREAAGQWTAGFNPRPVNEDDLLNFYETAY